MTNLSNEDIVERIKHCLTIFPKVSPTMLQMGIGAYINAVKWQPQLEQMIVDGIVIREFITLKSPAERWKSYTLISLKSAPELSTLMLPGSAVDIDEEEEEGVDESAA